MSGRASPKEDATAARGSEKLRTRAFASSEGFRLCASTVGVSVPSLHGESTDSLIYLMIVRNKLYIHNVVYVHTANGNDTSKRRSNEDGLDAGAVAAIVVLLFLALAVIGIVLVLLYCYRLRMKVAKKVTDYGMCIINTGIEQ